MPEQRAGLDQVFHALADPTRRKVVERLVTGSASTSELARPFDMALPSFTQHLRVLERAGLVTSTKAGRVRTYRLAPAALGLADGWLADQRRLWEQRLDQLDTFLGTLKEQAMTATPDTPYAADPNLDLVLEREVDVPADLVWEAWTTPEHIKQWFAPKPFETPECEMDLRPGGAFRTVMRSPEGEEFPGVGCFLEIIPNQRLTWTSALAPGFRPTVDPDGLPFTAVIELQPTASGGTRYRAVAIHQDAEGRKRHEEMGFAEGWGAALDQLVSLAKTLRS